MEVSIEEFGALDLRVGEVLEAEEKEGGILVKVDVGSIKRAFLGSMDYNPKELLGRKVVVLVNAEEKATHGIETNALILTVKHDKKVSLLTVDGKIKNGAKIK